MPHTHTHTPRRWYGTRPRICVQLAFPWKFVTPSPFQNNLREKLLIFVSQILFTVIIAVPLLVPVIVIVALLHFVSTKIWVLLSATKLQPNSTLRFHFHSNFRYRSLIGLASRCVPANGNKTSWFLCNQFRERSQKKNCYFVFNRKRGNVNAIDRHKRNDRTKWL